LAFIPSRASAVAFLVVWWLIVYAMDRRQVYSKL
jgi:hypothetical protein